MILSIQIPTVKGREEKFDALKKYIYKQIIDLKAQRDIEVISICDNKEISIGKKRDQLYRKTDALYSWQIDDDDWIHAEAIKLILEASKENADCITFKELCIYEGKRVESSNHSIKYKYWTGALDGFNHVRTPFHKSPIKTILCQQVGVKDMRFGEDHDFAQRIQPLLKTEAYINEFIYIYRHNHEPHKEKYGFK